MVKLKSETVHPQLHRNNNLNFYLKMKAREMMSFMRLFPLMVGDFVPHDDEVWLFLLNFLDIIDILLSSDIPRDLAKRLKIIIKVHHAQYINLFNDTLKPKHHLMLHYYNVILKSGPPRHFWCFDLKRSTRILRHMHEQ